jgi:hypothetical protein
VRQQLAARLHDQDQARLGKPGSLRAAGGRCHGLQRGAALAEQHLAGGCQPGAPAGPLDKDDAQAALKLANRPRERQLSDAEPLSGAAEVQLLGQCYEVAQFPGLHLVHTGRVSAVTQPVLACGRPGNQTLGMADDVAAARNRGSSRNAWPAPG